MSLPLQGSNFKNPKNVKNMPSLYNPQGKANVRDFTNVLAGYPKPKIGNTESNLTKMQNVGFRQQPTNNPGVTINNVPNVNRVGVTSEGIDSILNELNPSTGPSFVTPESFTNPTEDARVSTYQGGMSKSTDYTTWGYWLGGILLVLILVGFVLWMFGWGPLRKKSVDVDVDEDEDDLDAQIREHLAEEDKMCVGDKCVTNANAVDFLNGNVSLKDFLCAGTDTGTSLSILATEIDLLKTQVAKLRME